MRGFLLRYAAANAFATCRALERCRGTDSMWEWQWALLCRLYCADAQPRRNIHVPVAGAQRRTCAHCGKGRTQYVCSGCSDTPLHVQCFASADLGLEAERATPKHLGTPVPRTCMHALGTGYARKSGEPLGFRPKEGTCANTGAHPPGMTSSHGGDQPSRCCPGPLCWGPPVRSSGI